jgi:diguanylate cyclase (GGDEF)-like protein/PAS domain S-box-containing protein
MLDLNTEEQLNLLSLLSRAVDASINGVIITKTIVDDYAIIYANKRFYELTGYDASDVIGRNCRFLANDRTSPDERQKLKQALETETEIEVELLNFKKDGSPFWNRLFVSPVYDDQNRLTHFIGILSDFTQEYELKSQLEFTANYDALTGLANRQTFESVLEHTFAQCKKKQSSFFVFFIDLDDFKPINDTLGHETGDEVLKIIASKLKDFSRDSDVVARLGGDEFVMLIHDITALDDAVSLSKRILETISEPLHINQHYVQVSASIGIADNSGYCTEASQVLRHADMAMYRAKNEGRNQYALFRESVSTKLVRRQQIKRLISTLLSNKKLDIVFRPIVNAIAEKTVGLEPRLEIQSSESTLEHGEIFHIAKDTGQLFKLNELLITLALQEYFDSTLMPDDQFIMLPVFEQYFKHVDFERSLRSAFSDHAAKRGTIFVSLPDSCLTTDDQLAKERVKLLEELDIKICLYNQSSGFATLREVNPTVVSAITATANLTHAIEYSLIDQLIVESLVKFGNAMSIPVIFEGVDNDNIMKALQSLNASHFSGALFSTHKNH